MLTALNIEDHTRRGAMRLLSFFRHNRIRVEHLYCDSAAVKSVVYELHRGRVNWNSVERFVHDRRGCVLCPEGAELPDQLGYRRFVSRELNRRMCENAALHLLQEPGMDRVRVALLDDTGEHAGLCSYLVDCTDRLLVLTRSTSLYMDEADRILEERGAVIRIAAAGSDLHAADLIIAPRALREDIRCSGDAVVLSGERPLARQNAPVIYDYIFDLPAKYRRIKPPYLDDMYFASALYSLGGVHELGSSVFRRCYDGQVLHTRMSLSEQLRNRLKGRENSPI